MQQLFSAIISQICLHKNSLQAEAAHSDVHDYWANANSVLPLSPGNTSKLEVTPRQCKWKVLCQCNLE